MVAYMSVQPCLPTRVARSTYTTPHANAENDVDSTMLTKSLGMHTRLIAIWMTIISMLMSTVEMTSLIVHLPSFMRGPFFRVWTVGACYVSLISPSHPLLKNAANCWTYSRARSRVISWTTVSNTAVK